MKRNWAMSLTAALVGIGMLSLAVFDFATSPADRRGIHVGSLFIPLGPTAPLSAGGSATALPTHSPVTSSPKPKSAPRPGPGPAPAPQPLPPGISGTWVLEQAATSSQVDNSAVEAALATPGIRGYSLRVPWSAIDGSTALLDQGLRVARAHRLAFSVRFMAGRWTPARVYVAGALPYVISGVRIPLPFTALGTPDTAFESAYRQEVSVLASWSRRNGVHLLHLPWYGALWNEYYLGPEVLRAPGYTYQAWLNAHERLAKIAWQFAGSDLTIEFPLSGVDDSTGRTVFSNLSSYANALAASSPTRLYVQTNGLGQPQFGLNVFGRGITVGHAQQMYNGADYDWSIIFTLVRASHDTYLEIYVNSFRPSFVHHAVLMVQVSSFR